MTGAAGIPSFVATDSAVESTRFGRRVKRYELLSDDAGPLFAELRADTPDLAIVRIPTRRGDLITGFCSLGGQFVLGDCRVIYVRDNEASGRPLGGHNPSFHLRPAVAGDYALLDLLVERIFVDYHTHYVSNPRLADYPLTDAYREWVRAYTLSADAARRCMVAEMDGEPCAFTTTHVTSQAGEVVLNGVLPEFRGRGVYRELLRRTVDTFIDAGASSTVIATQLDNRAVQRVWVSEGFRLDTSQYTIHINFPG